MQCVIKPPSTAGARLGDMPEAGLLASVLGGTTDGDGLAAGDITQEESGNEPTKVNQLVPTGPGLPALPKKVIDRIHAGDYIDFSDLPPAKGKVRPLSQGLEGQVILVQAQDLLHSKKLIQDLPTWVQCFAVFVAVVAQKQPERVPDLMAYATGIAKASKKFKWPSWVIYDQNFRQEAVSSPTQPWSKVDPSIYSQCFLGMAKSQEGWCQTCQSLDHATHNCPAGGSSTPRKRPWQTAVRQQGESPSKPVCLKFNRNNGECPFGNRCRFAHMCSRCRGTHPMSRCPLASSAAERGTGHT